MKNRELIAELLNYNLDAEVKVVANNKPHAFEIYFGGAEGEHKYNCESVIFTVDNTNTFDIKE